MDTRAATGEHGACSATRSVVPDSGTGEANIFIEPGGGHTFTLDYEPGSSFATARRPGKTAGAPDRPLPIRGQIPDLTTPSPPVRPRRSRISTQALNRAPGSTGPARNKN